MTGAYHLSCNVESMKLDQIMARLFCSRNNSTSRFALILIWVLSMYATYFYAINQQVAEKTKSSTFQQQVRKLQNYDYMFPKKTLSYDNNLPLIFIGGVPRSGTTLMRTMLDAHPEVRCGQETRVIPRILGMHSAWTRSAKEKERLEQAGISEDILNSAITQFVLEIIVKHGEPAEFLCNKDPFALKSTIYLTKLFPNAKFLLMLRDGRATAHSIISRKVSISGFDIKSYKDVMVKWNRAIENMYQQCVHVGTSACLPVHYEQLVLHPMKETKRIMEFLNITWDDAMINHEQHLKNISLSNVEKSTDQVQRPLYLEALTGWFDKFPRDVEENMHGLAPMLEKLGYDPHNAHPSYGEPDDFVIQKDKLARQ